MGYPVGITLTNQSGFDLYLVGLECDGDNWDQPPVAKVKAGTVTQLLLAHGGTAPFGPGCSGQVTYRWIDGAALVRRIDIRFGNPVVGDPWSDLSIDLGVYIDTTATLKQTGSHFFITLTNDKHAGQPGPPQPGDQQANPVLHIPYVIDNSSQVAAVSWGPDRIDVFCGSAAIPAPGWPRLIHGWLDNGTWQAERLDSDGFGPCATSWAPGRLDVFTLLPATNQIKHLIFEGGWQAPELIDAPPTLTALRAVARGQGVLSLVGVVDAQLRRLDYINGWTEWRDVGIESAGVAALSSANAPIDYFFPSPLATLKHAWHDENQLADPHQLSNEELPAGIKGVPAVASWAPGRIDLVAKSLVSPTRLQHLWHEGTWQTWEDLGGPPTAGELALSSWGPGRLDVFTVSNERLLQCTYSGGWLPWAEVPPTMTSG